MENVSFEEQRRKISILYNFSGGTKKSTDGYVMLHQTKNQTYPFRHCFPVYNKRIYLVIVQIDVNNLCLRADFNKNGNVQLLLRGLQMFVTPNDYCYIMLLLVCIGLVGTYSFWVFSWHLF